MKQDTKCFFFFILCGALLYYLIFHLYDKNKECYTSTYISNSYIRPSSCQ